MNSTSTKPLTDLLRRYIDRGEVAGAVALIEQNGKAIFSDHCGFADIGQKKPIEKDSIFRIASMTKPITSAAALMLVDEGVLHLNDPISQWIPELATPTVLKNPAADLTDTIDADRPITIHDLLMHRSGLAYPFTAMPPLADALRTANGALDIVPDYSPDVWLQRIAKLPLMYQPGARWHYGYSTDVLGVVIARAAKQTLGDFFNARIFAPLKMNDTSFVVDSSKKSRLTTAYIRAPQSGLLESFDATAGRWSHSPVFQSGGAGLISTASDYMAFARMLLNRGEANGKRLLSPRAIEVMTTDALQPAEHKNPFLNFSDFWAHQGFGLGLSVITDITQSPAIASPGQYNWPGAFGTFWFVAPEKNLIAILLFQEYWSASAIQSDFQNLVYEIV